jgi:acetyl-CoA carboxylase carboxyl transferase subunit alpha
MPGYFLCFDLIELTYGIGLCHGFCTNPVVAFKAAMASKGSGKTNMATTATEATASPAPAAQQPKASARHTLPFEQPLANLEGQIQQLEQLQTQKQADFSSELRQLRENYTSLLKKTYDNLSAWETVQVARHPQRPLFFDYVNLLCREFREIHGDRLYGDDYAIRCGLARIGTHKVVLIGHHKGRDTREKVKCYFGLAHPEGYRKALRAMKLAEKFSLPVVTLVDTPGAYPGIGAEERGQAESIARNMFEMARLRTPIISIITGEGGSGGALGIALADRVAMLEYAWYSVISPEACSAILYRGGEGTAQMADALKLTAKHLKRLNIIDTIVPEPLGGAHRDPAATAHTLELYITKNLRDLKRCKLENLLERRYERFRQLGEYTEPSAKSSKAAG